MKRKRAASWWRACLALVGAAAIDWDHRMEGKGIRGGTPRPKA